MSNRVKRGRTTPKAFGQSGVTVDREEGKIVLACFDNRSAFSVTWSLDEARQVTKLIIDAIEEPDKKEDTVLGSGLVIPGGGGGLQVPR